MLGKLTHPSGSAPKHLAFSKQETSQTKIWTQDNTDQAARTFRFCQHALEKQSCGQHHCFREAARPAPMGPFEYGARKHMRHVTIKAHWGIPTVAHLCRHSDVDLSLSRHRGFDLTPPWVRGSRRSDTALQGLPARAAFWLQISPKTSASFGGGCGQQSVRRRVRRQR